MCAQYVRPYYVPEKEAHELIRPAFVGPLNSESWNHRFAGHFHNLLASTLAANPNLLII